MQPPKANSAFHPFGVGKWVPASAGKAKAGMVHSVSGWTRGMQVKLWDPLERVPYPSALEVCSRRGAIQIHIYLSCQEKKSLRTILLDICPQTIHSRCQLSVTSHGLLVILCRSLMKLQTGGHFRLCKLSLASVHILLYFACVFFKLEIEWTFVWNDT